MDIHIHEQSMFDKPKKPSNLVSGVTMTEEASPPGSPQTTYPQDAQGSTIISSQREGDIAEMQDSGIYGTATDGLMSEMEAEGQQEMSFRETLTVKAFNQLDRLKNRIDRQQNADLAKRNRQYVRVNESMKQT